MRANQIARITSDFKMDLINLFITLLPLHKSPLQQLMSNLVIFTAGLSDLRKSDESLLRWDETVQCLAWNDTDTS